MAVENYWKQRAEESEAIVARVWAALGITDYAGAGGKAIDELVAELKRRDDAAKKAWDDVGRQRRARRPDDEENICECGDAECASCSPPHPRDWTLKPGTSEY